MTEQTAEEQTDIRKTSINGGNPQLVGVCPCPICQGAIAQQIPASVAQVKKESASHTIAVRIPTKNYKKLLELLHKENKPLAGWVRSQVDEYIWKNSEKKGWFG